MRKLREALVAFHPDDMIALTETWMREKGKSPQHLIAWDWNSDVTCAPGHSILPNTIFMSLKAGDLITDTYRRYGRISKVKSLRGITTMPKNLAYDEFINAQLAEADRPFSPFAEYDADGDCIEFFAKPDPYYAERIDGLLTVYRSRESNEIIGSQIKGVSHLWREILVKNSNFTIEVHDGKIRLAYIFRAKLWSLPREKLDLVEIYRFLTDEAERSNAEIDAPCATLAPMPRPI